MTVSHLTDWLDRFAPPASAAGWDNVGLLVGDASAVCERVMTCLTLTDDVAQEAIDAGVQLIVSHHPLPFKAVKRLTMDTPEGRVLLPLIKAGIAVHSPHTAFDNCPGGINDHLANLIGLEAVRPLRQEASSGQYKLTVFVPESDYERVAEACFAAGAGRIGANDRYTECGFRLPGIGTFKAGDEANPTVGSIGVRENVAELRFETIVPASRLVAVVRAMSAAHSYEEPAYDLYPVSFVGKAGQGRVGDLSQPVPLSELVGRVRERLRATTIQVVGEADRRVRRVAVACGAAGEFLTDAIRERADCFLTGELRFHDALTARSAGIAAIVPGHDATERPGVEMLARRLSEAFPTITSWASRVERDPIGSFDSFSES